MEKGTTRITRATVRAFIRKAGDRLEIFRITEFDSMEDGVRAIKNRAWKKTQPDTSRCPDHTEGIEGAWFVGGGSAGSSRRDYFQAYDDGERVGFRISNSCGSFVLAVVK